MTPCITAEKTGGLSSDVREIGNGRYEQKAVHAINQVLRELERLQSVRRERVLASGRLRGWSPFNIVSGSPCEELLGRERFFRRLLLSSAKKLFTKDIFSTYADRNRRKQPARPKTSKNRSPSSFFDLGKKLRKQGKNYLKLTDKTNNSYVVKNEEGTFLIISPTFS